MFKYFHSVFVIKRSFRTDARYLFSYHRWRSHNLPNCAEKMLDSGALSGILKQGMSYCDLQDKLVEYANNQKVNRAVMLDVPCFVDFLNKHKIHKEEAHDITFRNAQKFHNASCDFKKFYVIQGPELSDYTNNCRRLKHLIGENDGVCVGGLLGNINNIDFLVECAKVVKKEFPTQEIHFMAVGNLNNIRKLITYGIDCFDSSRSEQRAKYLEIEMIRGHTSFKDHFGFTPNKLTRNLFSLLANLAEINLELNFLKVNPYLFGDIINHNKMGRSLLIKE
jgi:hypothetical protein